MRIFGEEYEVKAEVATIGGLSAHAGQDFLEEYALRVKGRVKKVFLVHGEARTCGGTVGETGGGRHGQTGLPAVEGERGSLNVWYNNQEPCSCFTEKAVARFLG